jgi:hypothetical protein
MVLNPTMRLHGYLHCSDEFEGVNLNGKALGALCQPHGIRA